MAANRWVLPLVASVGLTGLPACVTFTHSDPPTVIPPPAPPAQRSEFAAFPRGPGEQVLKQPAAEPVVEIRPPAADHSTTVSNSTPIAPPTPGPLPLLTVPPVPTPEPPLLAAVRAYLDNRPDIAVEILKTLDRPNQELVLQLIPAVVRASQLNLQQAGPHDLAVLQGQLEGAAAALGVRTPLLIERACFCRSVRTFGLYDPLPDQHAFRPGTPTELYAEVKNAPSEPVSTPDGDGYATNLACSLQILDTATGKVVEIPVPGPNKTWRMVPQLQEAKRDFRRSPVRDYFLVFRFTVPTRPGRYTVTVTVTDPANGREVTRTMPFRVGG